MAVDEALIDRLRDVDCMGILLWGSHAKDEQTSRSDIDICIVAGPGRDRTAVLRSVWQRLDRPVDVKIFEDLPMYLQGEVFMAHRVLVADDEPELFEYLRPFWKRWNDQAHRQRLTDDEARALFAARRTRGPRRGEPAA